MVVGGYINNHHPILVKSVETDRAGSTGSIIRFKTATVVVSAGPNKLGSASLCTSMPPREYCLAVAWTITLSFAGGYAFNSQSK